MAEHPGGSPLPASEHEGTTMLARNNEAPELMRHLGTAAAIICLY